MTDDAISETLEMLFEIVFLLSEYVCVWIDSPDASKDDERGQHTCKIIDAVSDSIFHVENTFNAVPKFTRVQYFSSHGSHDLVVTLQQQVK